MIYIGNSIPFSISEFLRSPDKKRSQGGTLWPFAWRGKEEAVGVV